MVQNTMRKIQHNKECEDYSLECSKSLPLLVSTDTIEELCLHSWEV